MTTTMKLHRKSIVMESTPNGVGNYFYKEYLAAKFVPWYWIE